MEGLGLLTFLLLLIGCIAFLGWGFSSLFKTGGFKATDGSGHDPGTPRTRLMRAVLKEVADRVESMTGNTQISCRVHDDEGVLTLVADIEQFEQFRKRRGLWQWEGLFEEQRIERQWARLPAATRCWDAIQMTVPVAIDAAFKEDPRLHTVRFHIGDMENDRLTACRVSVEAKRRGPHDWRYDKRARGYLAPVIPHDYQDISASRDDFESDPYDFERQVARMLQQRGLTVEVTGGPSDEGVDIVARDFTPITGGEYLVQCKRYAADRKVGVSDVRELYGTVQEKRASKGVLVTSATFTAQARRFAEGKPLELIDGVQLQGLLEGLGTGKTDNHSLWREEGAVQDAAVGREAVREALRILSEGHVEEDIGHEFGEDTQDGADPVDIPLHEAAAEGDLDRARVLLAEGADINLLDGESFTPLQRAVLNGAGPGMLGLLLNYRGMDIDARGAEGYTALHMAIMKEEVGVVALLIEGGADVEARDDDGLTPLHIAVAQGDLSIIESLLGNGADVNTANAYGTTALHGAVKMNPSAIPVLINHGANTESHDGSGATPLLLAVAEGQTESIRLLIDGGANVNERGGGDYLITPLHLAISPDTDPSILSLLIDYGADIEAKGAGGMTPLHLAIGLGTLSTVSTLLARGADPHLRNDLGLTAYDVARRQGAPEYILRLLRPS